MTMTLVAGILIMVAQKMTDKTSIVSSLNGAGLIGLALFSMIILREKVGPREWGAVLLIICGTAVVSYFNVDTGNEKVFYLDALVWNCAAVTLLFTVALTLSVKLKLGRAFVFAAVAGIFLGLMNVFYHTGPIVAGGDSFFAQFKTAYPYIGFMLGNSAFVMTNLAFFHGSGITVVPTVNSFMIISPMLFEIFIFKVTLVPVQYLGAAIIVAGVIFLTTAKGHKVA